MLQTGSIIDGKYKVLDKLGQGGMSVVYLALNERANKMWAIKEIRRDSVPDFEAVRQSLIEEISILKQLRHRYLPEIVDVIDDGETFLVVMDYIQGKSLKEILEEKMASEKLPISVADVIAWGRQLSEVLYYLHTRPEPVIYRDIKPANVMIKPDGEISLIDFGTARIFKAGSSEDTVCLGTPGYAAPEQYGGSGQTVAQTDIYCLGAMLHHLITGRKPALSPFNFPKITKCRPTLIEETPRAMRNILLGLELIIDKCTQYNIKDRYATCAALLYDLEHSGELGLPYREKLKQRMAVFCTCAGLSAAFGAGALYSHFMEAKAGKSGYDYCMREAAVAADYDKKALYEQAVGLKPERADAYLALLCTMTEDNVFSAEEESELLSLLSAQSRRQGVSNKQCLEKNQEGFIEFSYELGLAYYYLAGSDGDKPSAAGWFNHVTLAEMDCLDFGERDQDKYRWQARARILGRISSYYKNKLGAINQTGDAQVSYLDYWNDLCALMDEKLAERDNIITELRLYNEIVYQICTRTVEFKNEAGLAEADLDRMLSVVLKRISAMDVSSNALAGQLILQIRQSIDFACKNIEAAYFDEEHNEGA